jgi:light-regulated signal transduction histidine kinase (bacteriophytochrome)
LESLVSNIRWSNEHHRIFVEFQQLDAGFDPRYRGTGLGLALTKRIVEAQGGRVGFCSVSGSGSTFYATLPRNAAGATSADVTSRQTAPVGEVVSPPASDGDR